MNTPGTPLNLYSNTPSPPSESPYTGSFQIIVASSLDQIAGIREEWSFLQDAYGQSTTATDPNRFLAELKGLPNFVHPYIAIFRYLNQPRAAIIGRICRRRMPCPMGLIKLRTPMLSCLDLVYGGLMSDGSPPAHKAILEHLLGMLDSRKVDLVTINHLPVTHELYDPLLQKGALENQPEPRWWLRLIPGAYEETIKGLSRKHRYNLRRNDQLLGKHFLQDVVVRMSEKKEELDEFISGTAALAAKTYQAKLGCSFTDNLLWRSIFTAEAQAGRLRFYWLVCGGQPIAFQIGVVYKGCYSLYHIGHLPQYNHLSPGMVLHQRIIQDLCEKGLRQYNYGFGDADYKRIYGTDSSKETVLHLYGRHWRARVARLMEVCATSAVKFLKLSLGVLGILKWMKKKWRSHLREKAQAAAE